MDGPLGGPSFLPALAFRQAWCLEGPDEVDLLDVDSPTSELPPPAYDDAVLDMMLCARGDSAVSPFGQLVRNLSGTSLARLPTSPTAAASPPPLDVPNPHDLVPSASIYDSLNTNMLSLAIREMLVVAAFGSHQVGTLVSGLAAMVTSGSTRPAWGASMHLGLHFVRSNVAFPGVSIPRLRFWSNAVGASRLPPEVELKLVSFTIDRALLLTFEAQGAEWRKKGMAGRCPTVPLDTAHLWSAQKRKYDLEGEWISPVASPDRPKMRNQIIYYLHGGAYITGSPKLYRILTGRLAQEMNCKVFVLRYRLAPESPFPAAIHDAFAGYLYLVDPHHPAFRHLDPTHDPVDPANIVIMGDSAGAGLALSLLNYLNMYLRSPLRNLLLPMPGAAVFLSPWLDLTFRSASWRDNDKLDWLPAFARDIHADIAPGVPHPVKMYLYGEACTLSSVELAKLAKHLPVSQPGSRSASPSPLRNGTGAKVPPRPSSVAAAASPESPPTDEETAAATTTVKDRVERFVRHPLVSPIFADTLAGLPPILVQAGDAEVLRDDSLALAKKYDKDNVGKDGSRSWLRHEMYSDMVHVWIVMPWLKESATALRRIKLFLDEVEEGRPKAPASGEDLTGILIDSHVGL
ncbi:hypothetical protein HKX48_007840 [Thoreauomyces humboldtii]|nr:hypothetical protein HKX48_007840 [Thoreauomyces humboldtii]